MDDLRVGTGEIHKAAAKKRAFQKPVHVPTTPQTNFDPSENTDVIQSLTELSQLLDAHLKSTSIDFEPANPAIDAGSNSGTAEMDSAAIDAVKAFKDTLAESARDFWTKHEEKAVPSSRDLARQNRRMEPRLRQSADRLCEAVKERDSEGMIGVMCDLTPFELRDVVCGARTILDREGLNGVELRVDDFDRIVLFDSEKNKGVAMAPSGAYQRVSRFYDGSYRYGIELLLDESLQNSLNTLFDKMRCA